MKFTPHPYQEYCIQRVVDEPFIELMLDMGLGKTVIVLKSIMELKFYRFQISKVLIIAPKKVAEATWCNEAAKWDELRPLRFSLVLGSEKKRLAALDAKADIYVTNRENTKWIVEHYKHAWPFDMVVLDEASSFKNHQAQRFKAMKAIRPRIKRLVELTGTPTPKGLIDLWAQIFLLDAGKRLGRTISTYRDLFFVPDQRNAQMVFSYKPRAVEALGTNLSEFFSEQKQEKVVFTDEEMFIKEDGENGYSIRWLVPNAQKNALEPILVTLEPNGCTEEDDPHEGEEFGYLLSGSVTLFVGNVSYKIKKGYSFCINPASVHYIKNTGKTQAKLLWVATPPSF